MSDLELGGALIGLLDEIRYERSGTRPGSGCYYQPDQARLNTLLERLGRLLRSVKEG